MRIPDFFRMNDRNIRKFAIVILSFLIAYDSTFLINKFLFKVSILPQLLGFIVLTFIPGFVILRILKVHNIDRVTNFLLAVGLSLSFLIIFGLFLNTLLPYIGISKPISPFPLFYSFNIGVLCLLLIAYLRDKGFKPSKHFLDINLSPWFFSLLLLPFFAIFGTHLMNYYNSNILLLVLLFLVSLIPILVAFHRIPENLYPLTVFVVSISVLLHTSLISDHIWGYDPHDHYYIANFVKESGFWDPNFKHVHNSLLMISLFLPIYSLLSNLSLIWLMKIVFPFIVSLIPLALYIVYKQWFNERACASSISTLATLSVFVLIFYPFFFLRAIDKQFLGQTFLALIMLVIVQKSISELNKKIIAILLSFLLIVSYYGASYLFLIALIFSFFVIRVGSVRTDKETFVSADFILFFACLSIAWFMYTSVGIDFSNIVKMIDNIIVSIAEIMEPMPKSGMAFVQRETPVLWTLFKYLQVALQVLISLGIFKELISFLKKRVQGSEFPEFLPLSVAFYGMVILQITVTYGAGMERILLLALMLLSPFATDGCMVISEFFRKTAKMLIGINKAENLSTKTSLQVPIKFFAFFLMILFLFNSGFIFEVCKDPYPLSFAISHDVDYGGLYTQSEIRGAIWARSHIACGKLCTQYNVEDPLLREFFLGEFIFFHANTSDLPSHTYVFLGELASKKGKIYGRKIAPFHMERIDLRETRFYKTVLREEAEKIYDSDGLNIYYVQGRDL